MPLGLIVLLVGLAVVVIAAGIGGTLALTRAGHTVATRTAAPTAPATVTATAMPPNWFDFKDPLNGTVGHEWPVSDTCYFRNGAYHVDPGTAYVWYLCYATRAGKFSDFDVHVTVEEESGPLNYGVGLVFRYVSTGNFYTFTIDGNGDAWVSKWTDKKPENISSTWNPSPFTQGLHVPHTLRVTAEGPLFSFYVDGTEVGSVRDTTYTDGDVGLFSGGSQLDAAFTNFEVAGAE